MHPHRELSEGQLLVFVVSVSPGPSTVPGILGLHDSVLLAFPDLARVEINLFFF